MGMLSGIRSALGLLTIIPVGSGSEQSPDARAVGWFPWVGLLLGGISFVMVAAADLGSAVFADGDWLPRASFVFAAVVLALWAVFTRMLHWDGLADVGDAWWGGSSAERRLEIMADTSVGAFGATAVVITLTMQLVAMSILIADHALVVALVAAPVFGRCALVFASWLGKPARPDGLGALIMRRPTALSVLIAAAAILVTTLLLFSAHDTHGLLWAGFSLVVAAAVPHLIALRMGGVTGDVMGASVLVSETILLVTASLVVAF